MLSTCPCSESVTADSASVITVGNKVTIIFLHCEINSNMYSGARMFITKIKSQWRHMSVMTSQITRIETAGSAACSDKRKYQSSTLLTLCVGNQLVTGGSPSQRATDAESDFMSWRHHAVFGYAWISNYTHYKVWDIITYPVPNVNGCTVDVWECIRNFKPHLSWVWLLIHAKGQVNRC